MSSEAVAPEGSEAEQAATAPAPEQDDVKAKFLAALAQKKGGKGGAGGAGGDPSKIHGTHAAAASKRNFRRKSGG
ncbi:DUF5302 domain-containing protein [Kitasatospora sp. McL0602]|uniref:DUF5302 domain-containing protein n=1 Tax=Kitasatospora sp. McL0602 TaxID=3439530 RepID=UPI003F8C4DE9